MTDQELLKLCERYGRETLAARRKFAGLLPEVFKRSLYRKKGFGSIFEFAAKLAGMSHEQVNVILKLDEKFADKPCLRGALVKGEVSPNKLNRIVSIATKENEKELLGQVKNLSNRAVETLVRDEKSVHVHEIETKLQLDNDVKIQLAEMQNKGIDVNEFLREVLKKREEEIEKEKDEIAEEEKAKKSTRYIRVKTKKLLKKEHGIKCSIPNCCKPAVNIHHTRRFAMCENNDPYYLAPLCREHHEIAHAIDWRVGIKKSPHHC
jgi:hypothetical protein